MKKKLFIVCLLCFASGSLFAQKMGMKKPVLQTEPVGKTVLELSPNPARDWLDIRLNLPERTGFILEIYNERGIRILSKEWSGEKISLTGYASGVYVICLRRDKERYSAKVIVER